MSQGKRYKFNGSTFKVSTGYGANKTITGITNANPGVVSVAAHGGVLGDVVLLTDPGIQQLDGALYPIDNPLTGSFELPVDTTDYDVFAAGSPTGDSHINFVTFSTFCELTGVNRQGGSADQIEVSTICSDAKEFEQGLSDAGTLQLDFNLAVLETVQAAMKDAEESGDKMAFKITFPNGGGTVILIGTVQQSSFNGAVNGVWKGSVTVKLTGKMYVLDV